MAMKFITNLDLNQNQLINATFEKLATDPSGFEGRTYYNTTTDTVKVFTGSAWVSLPHTIVSGGGAGIAEALTVSAQTNGTITLTLNVADTDSAGLMPAAMWQMLTDATDAATASKLVKRDGNGNAKVATPTDAAHIATKGYVDSARQGLDVKASVRVATTAPINLATDLDAGSVIDGVTLVAGDRVLVKNQSSASENGIYVAVPSGAASRSSDANGTPDTGELTSGTFTFVEAGTVNSDSGFVISTDGTITVGTTGITWTQFSGAGSFEAGDGLSKSGTQVNVNDDDVTIYVDGNDDLAVKSSATAGQVLRSLGSGTAEWGAVDLDDADAVTGTLGISNGGTNASTEATARENLAAGGTQGDGVSVPVLSRKVSLAIGDGTATSYTVTHGFNTRTVMVQVYDATTYDTVIADTVRTTVDAVTVSFSVAPSSNAYVVVVIG